MKEQKKEWWKEIDTYNEYPLDFLGNLVNKFIIYAWGHDLASTFNSSLMYTTKEAKQQIVDFFLSNGFIRLVHSRSLGEKDPEDYSGEMTFVSDIGCARLTEYGSTRGVRDKERYQIYFVTSQQELFDVYAEFLIKIKLESREDKKGKLYMITATDRSVSTDLVGDIDVPMITDNYTEEVVSKYNHIVEDLKTQDPCGRLVIINGAPGTGKTYLLRGLITELKNRCKFVFVPPDVFVNLSGPGMARFLLNENTSTDKVPFEDDDGDNDMPNRLVLIVEDADAILVNREKQALSNISAVLNLSDGLIGTALNLTIIATTNQETLDIDEAVKRPGRLCSLINIDMLEQDHAKRVYNRLTGVMPDELVIKRHSSAPGFFDDSDLDRRLTLSEVYTLAAKHKENSDV